jgi:hypothetical protein
MPRLAPLAILLLTGPALRAQATHPAVCAKGVRTYNNIRDVPAPFDSLKLPSGPPIRVSSPEEAEAADVEMHRRAGVMGATGLVVMEVVDDDGASRTVHRQVIPVFVPADTARAYGACRS